MALLRALQRQGIISDLPARPPNDGVVRLVPQTLTSTSSEPLSPPPPYDSAPPHHASPSTPMPSSLSALYRRDNLIVGTRVVVAADADLRGEISVGSGTVIHPKATILALSGPISIGSNCIIEETAVIVNRRSTPFKIGDNNLFEVGCRIEAAAVGSYNVFEVRSKVAHNVSVGSYSVVGAGCTVLPKPVGEGELEGLFDEEHGGEGGEGEGREVFEALPDRTVVYGSESKRRLWSGEGAQQQAALHAKHLEYLRDAIPRVHKLKIIQGVRAPAATTTTASASAGS